MRVYGVLASAAGTVTDFRLYDLRENPALGAHHQVERHLLRRPAWRDPSTFRVWVITGSLSYVTPAWATCRRAACGDRVCYIHRRGSRLRPRAMPPRKATEVRGPNHQPRSAGWRQRATW